MVYLLKMVIFHSYVKLPEGSYGSKLRSPIDKSIRGLPGLSYSPMSPCPEMELSEVMGGTPKSSSHYIKK